MKRLLNCTASDFMQMSREELIAAIRASEGRVIVSETVVSCMPAIPAITNAEISRAAGADLILLNTFDAFHPVINGLDNMEQPIQRLKELIGRPIGVNLEPVDSRAKMLEERIDIVKGRQVSIETLNSLNNLGVDFVCITGNPGTGVTNQSIIDAIQLAKDSFRGMIIAGKMHGAGSKDPIYDIDALESFAKAGADVILLPSPGTVPGSTVDVCYNIIRRLKKYDVLTMGGLGTSQETSDVETIRQIGLYNKMVGFDIHHIGDAGEGGVSPFENIFELSKVVRGRKHTLKMICTSNAR
ncbi:DUF7916 family protein [Streptococcus marmotae]|uniref:DUF7916 family protein n=1 Tax=Streptococcus marmotae TaxID=1825069 RepID=UPI000834815B|nr:PEP phosphonomutase [Streptococcus marmotae]